ncbi:protein YajO [Hyphomonas adhaerens MHS-3]|uniref:Protein YajO n=1 Tax=Hyphomonas adhaerens MHS-3 TaxID=1280949 RepID=A0A069E332_9PROT|nr:aldo/keto reductase [Hyphomonas adhaerens]KCZ84555.1 protein YajO [Hyphomonas adhaerens MHS-3]
MDYVNFGNTGLKVSRLCLGCMSFGEPDRGQHPWSLTEDASRPLIRRAVELGFNFFDTANMYSGGSSEEIIGRALKDFAYRDEIVIATKAHFPWRLAPNTMGLSRKSLFAAIDDSLSRLGTDYVDLFQIHRFDPTTPIEETMEALHDIVKAGKARYIGASSMWAWQFQKMQVTAKANGWTQFVSMQNYVNLLYREEEREMLPYCASEGVAVMPWSPLARGRLTRDWDETTERSETDRVQGLLYTKAVEADKKVVETVAGIAKERGVPRAQVAMAWLLHKPVITSPIIGATKMGHLEDAVAATELKLSDEEIARLEAPYVPHEVVGLEMAPPFDVKVSLKG